MSTVSRGSAGAAIRSLRESRDWSLADLAAATGVSMMGLSYLERGARKPHKTTIDKLEAGLGLPPGTYSRLLSAADPATELAELTATAHGVATVPQPVVVNRDQDTRVLEEHAEVHIDSLRTLMERLPEKTSNGYETYIRSVITQCVKAEMLAASSWRVAVTANAESGSRLLGHLKELDAIRAELLALLPLGIGAQFDRACAASGLPDAVIAALLGVGAEDMWDMRNRGVVPPGALPRVSAFVDAVL